MRSKRFFIFFILIFISSLFSYKGEEVVVRASDANITFEITSGRTSSLLLSSNNTVYGWGLWGEGSNVSLSKKYVCPTDISSNVILDEYDDFIGVYSGEQHSFLLTSFGRVFAFGSGEKGQLGYQDYIFKSNLVEITSLFELLENEKITFIACGDDFNVCLTSKNRVLTFGCNEEYQLGIESTENSIVYDITDSFLLQDGDYIKTISCGASHTLALSNNGYVYMWGSNKFYQLGKEDCLFLDRPTQLTDISETIIKIACGRYSSYILTNQNQLYGFGSDSHGQLATCEVILTSNYKDRPFLMNPSFELQNDEFIVDIIAGYYFAIVKTNLSNYFSFGQNSSGQLATGSTLSTSFPKKIEYRALLDPLDEIVSISCGSDHCIASSKFGHILAWGSNLQNQLSEDSSISSSNCKIIDITYNFPPIIEILVLTSSVKHKVYDLEILAYYLDNLDVEETYYCISKDIDIPKGNWVMFDKNITLNEEYEGTFYVHLKINSVKGTHYHVSSPFFLDHINPQIKVFDKNNEEFIGKYSNSTIFVESFDNNSVVEIVYTHNGQTYSTFSNTLSLSDDGDYLIYAIDEANNPSATIEFSIDTILPTITKIDNNLIQSSSYSTREKTITIQGSEALSCYALGYKGVDVSNYIALNDNESTFEITLKKGVNTLTIFDLAGNQSMEIEIVYSPRFFQDTQLLLIVFSSLVSFFVLMIIIIYSIKNKKKLIK